MHLLSHAERQVLIELIRGHSQKEIAGHLGLAVSTVKFHLTRLRHHLGARSLPQMAAFAVVRGLVDLTAVLDPKEDGEREREREAASATEPRAGVTGARR